MLWSYLLLHFSNLGRGILRCGNETGQISTRNPNHLTKGEWTVQMQLALRVYTRPRHRSAINSYPSLQSLGPPLPDLAYTWALNLCTYAVTCHLAPTRYRNRTEGGPAPTTHYYWRPIPPDMDLRKLYPYRG